MYSRKDTSPNYIEFSKLKQELGDLLGPKNPRRKKFNVNAAFIYSKNNLGQIEKWQQAYLGEKEEKGISAIRYTVIYDAINLGLVPLLEITVDKE